MLNPGSATTDKTIRSAKGWWEIEVYFSVFEDLLSYTTALVTSVTSTGHVEDCVDSTFFTFSSQVAQTMDMTPVFRHGIVSDSYHGL